MSLSASRASKLEALARSPVPILVRHAAIRRLAVHIGLRISTRRRIVRVSIRIRIRIWISIRIRGVPIGIRIIWISVVSADEDAGMAEVMEVTSLEMASAMTPPISHRRAHSQKRQQQQDSENEQCSHSTLLSRGRNEFQR